MPAATNQQVQNYADTRVRPRCEQIRSLYLAVKDDKAAFDDIFSNLTSGSPWSDERADGPPHLLAASDALAWNTFVTQFIALVEGTFADVGTANSAAGQYPVVLKACVRPVGA